jgi:hypothetical protein
MCKLFGRSNMEALDERDVTARAEALAEALFDLHGSKADTFIMDLGNSGQCPFRIVIRDQVIPAIGQATVDAPPED